MWSRYISRYTNSHPLHFHLFGARSHLNHALLNPSPVPGRSPANPFCCGGLSLHKNPNGRWFSWRWGLGNPKNTSPNSRVYNLIIMYVYMYLDMYIIICIYVLLCIHTYNFFNHMLSSYTSQTSSAQPPLLFSFLFYPTETKIYHLPCAARLGAAYWVPVSSRSMASFSDWISSARRAARSWAVEPVERQLSFNCS